MKPTRFDYLAPTSLKEALDLYDQYSEDGKIIAGGQSLIPLLNMRLANPKYLIDLNGVKELSYIREENGQLLIGALTRHSEIEHSALVKEKCPLLAQAAPFIGHFQIRNRGTIGGAIAHADTTAEWACVASALDADIVVTNSQEVLTHKPEDFFLTYLTTNLMPGDIVTELRFPVVSGRTGSAFAELSRRHGDFGLVTAACQVELNDDDTVKDIRLALGAVDPVPYRATSAEEFLTSKKLTEKVIDEAMELIKEEIYPETDIHATAEYKKEMAGVYTKKAILQALERI